MYIGIRDFVEVWESMNEKGRKRVLRFLIEVYGRNELLDIIRNIETDINFDAVKKYERKL